jgi:hypothetical protein
MSAAQTYPRARADSPVGLASRGSSSLALGLVDQLDAADSRHGMSPASAGESPFDRRVCSAAGVSDVNQAHATAICGQPLVNPMDSSK